ncbi:MAG: hypothetical protein PVF32_18685, partial [Desulfobacterales bacterium]
KSILCVLPVTVEPFQFSPAEPVAYELSYNLNTKHQFWENEERTDCSIVSPLYPHRKHVLYASDVPVSTYPGSV